MPVLENVVKLAGGVVTDVGGAREAGEGHQADLVAVGPELLENRLDPLEGA